MVDQSLGFDRVSPDHRQLDNQAISLYITRDFLNLSVATNRGASGPPSNVAILNQHGGKMNWDSLIFIPEGGKGEFTDIAASFRRADPVPTLSNIIAIQHSHVEWVNVAASHIGLEAMSATGHFLPLALVPLEPFGNQTSFSAGFRYRPLFRLAWYGHPQGP
jgi:hypothetical protein